MGVELKKDLPGLYSVSKVSLLTRRIEFAEMTDPEQSASKATSKGISYISSRKEVEASKKDADYQALCSPESLRWQKIINIGPGLVNYTNTCFMNSVLQCVMYTPALANLLYHGKHQNVCQANGRFCVLCALDNLMSKCFNSTGKKQQPVNPSIFIKTLKLIAKHMRVGRQEDAHEYLRFLVDAMESSQAYTTGVVDVMNVFKGGLKSVVTCCQCKNRSETDEPFLDLSVDISRSSDTVSKCIEQFFKKDKLSGYTCEKCKKTGDALKGQEIHHFPVLLTLHLKRFQYGMYGGKKIDKYVQYPETLELKSGNGKSMKYNLHGLIVHAGSTSHSGHYYAFVKAPNGTWCLMDDDCVSSVKMSSVLNQRAYILFYQIASGQVQQTSAETPVVKGKVDPKKELSVKSKADMMPKIIEKPIPSPAVTPSTSPKPESRDIRPVPELTKIQAPPSPPSSEHSEQEQPSVEETLLAGKSSAARLVPGHQNELVVKWNEDDKSKKDKLQQVLQQEEALYKNRFKVQPAELFSVSAPAPGESSSKVTKRPSSYDMDYDAGKQRKKFKKKQEWKKTKVNPFQQAFMKQKQQQ